MAKQEQERKQPHAPAPVLEKVNFITRFIANKMENPTLRNAEAERHISKIFQRSKELIEQWRMPTKTDGFWRRDENQGRYRASLEPQLRGGVGRRTNWG